MLILEATKWILVFFLPKRLKRAWVCIENSSAVNKFIIYCSASENIQFCEFRFIRVCVESFFDLIEYNSTRKDFKLHRFCIKPSKSSTPFHTDPDKNTKTVTECSELQPITIKSLRDIILLELIYSVIKRDRLHYRVHLFL